MLQQQHQQQHKQHKQQQQQQHQQQQQQQSFKPSSRAAEMIVAWDYFRREF